MSNSFSFKRLWQVLKYEFAFSWRELFYYTLLAFVFCVFFAVMFNNGIMGVKNTPSNKRDIFIILLFVGLALSYAILTPYIVSRIFANMHHRPRCIQFLMLPATTGEKMAARFILYFVYICAINYVFGFMFENNDKISNEYINNNIISAFSLLPFMLCGCIFKRFAIVKTFIILIAISIIIAMNHEKINFYPLKDFIYYSIHHYNIVAAAFLAVGLVFCYFVGYKILKRKTIE